MPRMFWGIRGVGEDFSIPARCVEFVPRLLPVSFYSHVTAALLWGVPLPSRWETCTDLHVSVPRGWRAPDAAQIIGHQVAIRDDDVVLLDTMRVSSPARVWRELASLLDPADLIAAGDALVSRQRGLTTIAELAKVVHRDPSYPGRRNARDALPLLSDRAESRPESLLRLAMVASNLPPLLVNHDVLDGDSRFVARVDLAFEGYPVVVEYDGDGHRSDPRQWRRDVTRFGQLEDAGLTVVRATAEDLPGFERVIDRCRRHLRAAGWVPTRGIASSTQSARRVVRKNRNSRG
jgi:hypothetical protein